MVSIEILKDIFTCLHESGLNLPVCVKNVVNSDTYGFNINRI